MRNRFGRSESIRLASLTGRFCEMHCVLAFHLSLRGSSIIYVYGRDGARTATHLMHCAACGRREIAYVWPIRGGGTSFSPARFDFWFYLGDAPPRSVDRTEALAEPHNQVMRCRWLGGRHKGRRRGETASTIHPPPPLPMRSLKGNIHGPLNTFHVASLGDAGSPTISQRMRAKTRS